MAAGIVALTLEANPELTWRDVQHIIVRTSLPRGNLKVCTEFIMEFLLLNNVKSNENVKISEAQCFI